MKRARYEALLEDIVKENPGITVLQPPEIPCLLRGGKVDGGKRRGLAVSKYIHKVLLG